MNEQWFREIEDAVRRKVKNPLFATVVGPHLKGWASAGTPVQVSGAMVLSLREVLGLRPSVESKERRVTAGGQELLLNFHDVRRYLDQIARAANTAALEELHSPLVVIDCPEREHLKRISRALLTRLCYHDFRSRSEVARNRMAGAGAHVQDLLEAARILLTGAQVLETLELMSNLEVLIEREHAFWLRPFLARQREEGDAALLSPDEARLLDRELDAFDARLEAAHSASRLPDGVGSISSLDEFLVELRLRELKSNPVP